MAYQIMVDVMYHAPRGMTSAEENVLLAIAESVRQCDVGSREAKCSREELAWKARLSLGATGNAISGLVGRGALILVPLGKDRHGEPFYAHRGSVPRYVIPRFEAD